MAYRDLDKLTDRFREKVILWMEENPDIFITESWRSQARQASLYAQGRTKPGNIVTWVDGTKNKSKHQLGEAVDIAFNGRDLYPSSFSKWRKVANSAKKYGIKWGWDLWKTDKPHFQDDGEELIYNHNNMNQEILKLQIQTSIDVNSNLWKIVAETNRDKELQKKLAEMNEYLRNYKI